MKITLLLTDDVPRTYGDVPFTPDKSDEREVVWKPSSEFIDWVFKGGYGAMSHDILDLDDACDVLLSLGDVDYFDAGQCSRLVAWIDKRFESPVDLRVAPLFRKMREFAARAVELGTGIVVEL